MKLINIGFGNLISEERLVAIVSPDSAPIKRMVQETRERGMLIDATYGRKTASIFIMDSDHVILSALPLEKFSQKNQTEEREECHAKRENLDYFRPFRRWEKHGSSRADGAEKEYVFLCVRHYPGSPAGRVRRRPLPLYGCGFFS